MVRTDRSHSTGIPAEDSSFDSGSWERPDGIEPDGGDEYVLAGDLAGILGDLEADVNRAIAAGVEEQERFLSSYKDLILFPEKEGMDFFVRLDVIRFQDAFLNIVVNVAVVNPHQHLKKMAFVRRLYVH